MRFTNSPFERMMTQRPSPGRAAPRLLPPSIRPDIPATAVPMG